MIRVVVFGASGLLGSRLCPALRSKGIDVLTAGRSGQSDYRIDPTEERSVSRLLNTVRADHVINLAAATDVDLCEGDVAMACVANFSIPCAISKAIGQQDSRPHLLHISTDQVYAGIGNHSEEPAMPVNVYGLSKLAGELATDNRWTCILRTNFIGKSPLVGRLGFSDWVVAAFRSNSEVTLFQDVRFSALHMSSLCDIIYRVVNERPTGTFNAGSRNGVSKAEFAVALASQLGLRTSNAKIGSLADVKMGARRPLDMTMNVSRIEAALGIKCPDINEEITKTSNEYTYA